MKRNILISVFNKNNLEILRDFFDPKKDTVISTGGTAKALRKLGFDVKDVGDLTGFPEVMDGRVKTLHPKIHMGLLARKDKEEDLKTLKTFGAEFFDIVIGNLYDFEAGLKQNNSEDQQIELIDIGGPSFLRAAAKSFQRITVLCDPEDYKLLKSPIDLETRKWLAAKVFRHTAYYDSKIAEWLSKDILKEHTFSAKKVESLRYGENPQQSALWLKNSDHGLHESEIIQGKQLSYNNLLDLDSALQTLLEFENPATVCVKHTNPCGVSENQVLMDSVENALKTDPQSVFGGIVACNRVVDEAEAKKFSDIFLECIVAPGFTPKALELFKTKKNLRILSWPNLSHYKSKKLQIKSILGGYLAQTPDSIHLDPSGWKMIGQTPSKEILESLIFALKVCTHLKSNAIAIASGTSTIGLGMGQVSRIDAVEQAFNRQMKFHPNSQNMVLASDAFFPFTDSIEFIYSKGVKWVIQPGGSIKDEEVVSKARELGVTLVLTGERHFKH